jgi:hypothetical protein
MAAPRREAVKPEEMRKSAQYVSSKGTFTAGEALAWGIQIAAEICDRLDRLLERREEGDGDG